MADAFVPYPSPTEDARAVDYRFTEAELSEIQRHVAKYPDKTSAVMPALWVAQEKFGVLSTGAIQLVADTLGLSFAHVYGVATFYTMYLKEGVPAEPFHLVEVCTCFTCGECGGREVYNHAKQSLGVNEHGRSPDGKFYLREAECLGACDTPVVLQLNNRRMVFRTDAQKFDAVIAQLRRGETPAFESVPRSEVAG
ncbi:MAG: NAD(P)H-dependent oxidoreductase subunit E [Bacteroidia bacterium]|nr:NAD(P)H-dependent oxidoreductase subunit E [Bacteroidia bacterium]